MRIAWFNITLSLLDKGGSSLNTTKMYQIEEHMKEANIGIVPMKKSLCENVQTLMKLSWRFGNLNLRDLSIVHSIM